MTAEGAATHRARGFMSDNASSVCPEAWDAMGEANRDHVASYGDDAWTARAADLVRDLVGREDARVFFVFTGTAANALSLSVLAPHYGVAYCHPVAHVANDECGAPLALGHGLQLRGIDGAHGKVDPDALRERVSHEFLHSGKPAALSLTQATELGTVYSLADLRALRDAARELDLKVHVDGARLANACAALDATPAAIAEASGAHAFVVGGTKNGLMGTEAVAFIDASEAADAFEYARKQAGHLASKHRYLAAQWVGVLESGAWARNGAHANAMAARLEDGVRKLGVPVVHARDANELFVTLPDGAEDALAARRWHVHADPMWGGHRLVTAWDTREEDVDAFLEDLGAVVRG